MRNGVLEISADSSVWCQHLQMNRPRLLAALREQLGEDAPEDLRFRVGYSSQA
jgi:predicted nucleic acid-binding Zn ribbon protein